MFRIEYMDPDGVKVGEEFDSLPDGSYVAGGYQNEADSGRLFVARYAQGGTTLCPVLDENSRHRRINDPRLRGMTFRRGGWENE